ncbi:MAG TPA: hypothetical protein PLR25_21625, partial [Planctomycetaceae bacterium]|nr:hypothetical protein [Planctomycetaceae bacterium]
TEVSTVKSDGTNAICTVKFDHHISLLPKTPSPFPEPNWGEVVSKLSEVGLSTASQTASAARNSGYSPALVLAIAEHFQKHPGAWESAGVVRHTILNHPASLAADAPERWPAPSPEFALRQNQQRQRERDAAEQRTRDARAEQANLERIEREQLEQEFGGAVDGLSDAELFALNDAGPEAASYRNRIAKQGRKGPIVRSRLLRLMRDRMATKGAEIRAGPESDSDDDSPATIPFPTKNVS